MVLMCVSQSDDINFLESSRPKVRRDRVFPRVRSTLRRLTGVGPWLAAGINQQSVSGRRGEKKGIALANIEHREFEVPFLEVRSERVNGDENCGEEKRSSRNSEQNAIAGEVEPQK